MNPVQTHFPNAVWGCGGISVSKINTLFRWYVQHGSHRGSGLSLLSPRLSLCRTLPAAQCIPPPCLRSLACCQDTVEQGVEHSAVPTKHCPRRIQRPKAGLKAAATIALPLKGLLVDQSPIEIRGPRAAVATALPDSASYECPAWALSTLGLGREPRRATRRLPRSLLQVLCPPAAAAAIICFGRSSGGGWTGWTAAAAGSRRGCWRCPRCPTTSPTWVLSCRLCLTGVTQKTRHGAKWPCTHHSPPGPLAWRARPRWSTC